MRGKVIQLIKPYNPSTDPENSGREKNIVRAILSELEADKKYVLHDLVKKYQVSLGHTKIETTQNVLKLVVRRGKKLGIIKEIQREISTLDDFCKLPTIITMRQQLKDTAVDHPESKTKHSGGGTRKAYTHYCWHFSNYLNGKKFEIEKSFRVDEETIKIRKVTITCKNIEDLLDIRKNSQMANDPNVIKIIKDYLYDDKIHVTKSSGTMENLSYGIKAYFDRNNYPVFFKYDSTIGHKNCQIFALENDINMKLDLQDFFDLVTKGKSSVIEKGAAILKLHGGLDDITMADKFNWQGFEKLCKYFEEDDYHKWDIKKCPAMIKLLRKKPGRKIDGYVYSSFYDVDAIHALIDVLDDREIRTGKPIKYGDPMLLNNNLDPITDRWCSTLVGNLARKAKIQRVHKILHYYQNELKSHELRDLLKSTIKACGGVAWVAQEVIGHMPQDSYDKEQLLYPDKIRTEYMKASATLNIFSNISNSLKPTQQQMDIKEMIREAVRNEKEESYEKIRQEIIKEFKLKKIITE